MSASNNTIMRGHPPITEQLAAAGVINPGDLLQMASATTVVVHAGAGLNVQRLVALEYSELGKLVSTAYASGDTVKVAHLQSGDRVQLRLAASAAAVVAGAFLEAAADGTVRVPTTDAATDDLQREGIFCFAVEAVDNSGGGSEAFLEVEIL